MTPSPGKAPERPKLPLPGTVETIAIGPIPIFFCNTNTTMGLKGHCHTAALTVVYRTLGQYGYPSFLATNNALRARVFEITGVEHPFRDATNEDVLREIWQHLDGWCAEVWDRWGGHYQLWALYLDVLGVEDRIGHDPGLTRYTIEREA